MFLKVSGILPLLLDRPNIPFPLDFPTIVSHKLRNCTTRAT